MANTVHLSQSRIILGSERFRTFVPASSLHGFILDFEVLGGYRSGTATMNLRIQSDGWMQVLQVRRWTEHFTIIPDRRTVIVGSVPVVMPGGLFLIMRSLVIEIDDPSDYFFLGPVYSQIISPEVGVAAAAAP
jgi:hypothetical protein